MNKPQLIILFSLRLFFYFSIITLIFAHPGIAINFDRVGVIQWFIVIPVMAIIAFIPERLLKIRRKRIVYISLLIVLSLIAGVSIFGAIELFAAGLTSFILTFLLFQPSRSVLHSKLAKIAVFEPFFFAWVCLRLLALSRAGEEIAGQSLALTQFILVWTLAVFLLHSAIIYLCLYPKSFAGVWKEGAALLSATILLLLTLLLILPHDFVRNEIITNLLTERIPQRIGETADRGFPMRGGGRRTLPLGADGQRPELRGLPGHDWSGEGAGADEQRQFMIKIVIAENEPVYMGNSFRGQLDPVQGFLASQEEPFNNLVNQRLFVTWFNHALEPDLGREQQEVLSLSTLQQKYLPWRPVVVDPVILNEGAGPLRFIHQVVANRHLDEPLLLVNTPSRPLNIHERNLLAHYLEINLDDNDKNDFNAYLNSVMQNWENNRQEIIAANRSLWGIFSQETFSSPVNEHLETILALLLNFSSYQYNLNPDDDHSIAAIRNFLFNSTEGDCVEFANALALLGRLAGIPSRVVTGFLAAEGLQTIAHLRGLAALREQIPYLQQFPFENLFMVTNLHSHAWTQFFIPDYGWLDFEATAFSMPPEGMGDFNNWDVVIPLLDANRTVSHVRQFPWQAVGRAALFILIAAIVCAYTLRYGREIALYLGSRRRGRSAARSLYLLLLARLAADGCPIKPASKTAHEYSELFATPAKKPKKWKDPNPEQTMQLQTHLKNFAGIYSELRWRKFADSEEEEQRYQALMQEYKKILSMKKSGILHSIIRIFSLRGLAYL